MSFLIDESAVRRISERKSGNTYTVTASNLIGLSIDPSPPPLFPGGIFSTVSAVAPQMSPETIGRLFELRQQIVESGARLMTTEELDYEVAERKGRLLGD
jgi:hypothetical protein